MTPYPWLPMLLIAGAYLAMFGIAELARRAHVADAEQTRKFSHVAAGGPALALPVLFSEAWPVLVLAAGFVLFLLITRRAGWLKSVHEIDRRSVGAFLYPVGVATTFVLADADDAAYAIGVLALAVGDAAGSVVGRRWGQRRYVSWGQPKTLEGSAAVFLSISLLSAVVLLIAGQQPREIVATAVLVGLVCVLVEGALPWGLDNLGLPIAALVAIRAAGSVEATAGTLVAATLLFGLSLSWSRWSSRARPDLEALAGGPPGGE